MENENEKELNKKSGYVLLWRSFIDWEWFTDVNTCHLFQYCFLRANYLDTEWRGIKIKKGSFITSLESLSAATGLSKMQIRTAIKKLKMTGELTHQTTSRYSIITVNNYDLYQDINTQITRKLTSKQQRNNTLITTDNTLNTLNTLNNITTTNNNDEKIKNFEYSELNNERIKDLDNYYGEYKNVHLTKEQLDKLRALIFNQTALNNLIEQLSENIAQGKEKSFDFAKPAMHLIRIKKYWEYQQSKAIKQKTQEEESTYNYGIG